MPFTEGTASRSRPSAAVARRADLRTNDRHPFAIFTAVEGTLLEAATLRPGTMRQFIATIQSAGIPIVPITAMTLEEITPILRRLGLAGPVIIEAGGGIARPLKSGWSVEPCGLSGDAWLDVIRDIEERSGANLLVYSALPESDALRFSGRSGAMFRHSMERRFSEPFVIEDGDIARVREAAAALGFRIREDRRLLYLCRENDEGKAFARVRAELQCETAIALGGSPLDAGFLSRAEVRIIVPGADGQPDPALVSEVSGARIAPAPAPGGWVAAINDVWPMFAGARSALRV
jgi:mannosyl-3-phosphoglycerate phosphatase